MIERALRQAIETYRLQDAGLIVAVSGGADSVALLRLLHECQPEYDLSLVVAHLDHQLRPDSAEHAEWVARLCEVLKLPCEIGRANLHDCETAIEERARRARYEFLLRVAQQHSAAWVLVAQTADDQAETVLHHVIRGSGLRGLAGIPQTRDLAPGVTLLRPLLGVTREEILAALQSRTQTYLTDSTNADPAFTRNRIRHEILPLLREKLNPQAASALCRLARQSREAHELVEWQARRSLTEALRESTPRHALLHWPAPHDCPRALQRELLAQLWIQQDWPRQGLSFQHLERIVEMCGQGRRCSLDLPDGIHADFHRGVLTVSRKPETFSREEDE